MYKSDWSVLKHHTCWLALISNMGWKYHASQIQLRILGHFKVPSRKAIIITTKWLFTQKKFNLEISRNSCRLSARKELFELYFMLQCRAAESLTQLSTSIPPSSPVVCLACLGYRGLSSAWDGWVTESSLAAFESRDLPATPISFMLFSTPPGAPS